MVAEVLLGGVAEAVVGFLLEKGTVPLKERLGLVRDPITVAFDTALHRAVADTFVAHQDYDGALFHATFLKYEGAPLLAATLTPDDTVTGADLAKAWAYRPPASENRDDLVRWMTPVCDTFLLRLRHHLRARPALLAITQAQDTASIRADLERLNADLPRFQREQKDALERLNQTLLTLSQVLAPLLKDIHTRLTRGILPPTSQDDTGVQNFLLHYLGWEKQKVPFGGREQDLKQLDEWFYNPHSPQFLLMTAEAGKGKSALLTQWCALMLQRHDNVDVVFVPISIRFNTSNKEVFFSTLSARLAIVHNDQSNYGQMRGEDWQRVSNEYLKREIPQGRQLLVVIDAVDEATGWEVNAGFVPLKLPQGVKLVVSAREQAGQNWLHKLGWETNFIAAEHKVGNLSIGGVRAVLHTMSDPLDRLSADKEVLKKLYELTIGDPLLVRLYVDALIGEKEQFPYLKARDLETIKPGLAGYFDRWWQEQEHQWKAAGRNPLEQQKQVEEFLFAVATALGPLYEADILAVTEGISSFHLRSIVREVGRFVIGDGKQRGYTFSHPRLGYYFLDQLGRDLKDAWNQRFVAHGQSFLINIQQSHRTNWTKDEIEHYAYIIQHYTTHLQQGNATYNKYYNLLCHEWARAWEALRGTYDGLLRDLDIISKQSEQDTNRIRAMTIYIKCVLCRSSIMGLSSNISPYLLVEATRVGILSTTQAVVLIRQFSNEQNKAKAVMYFTEGFSPDIHFIEQLFEIATTIEDETRRAAALISIAPFLPQSVLNATYAIENEGKRVEILSTLVSFLSGPDRTTVLQLALDTVRTITDKAQANSLLITLVPHLTQAEQTAILPDLLRNIRTIRDEWRRAQLLVALVPLLPQSEKASVLQEALNTSLFITYENRRVQVLIALAPFLPQEVFDATNIIRDDLLGNRAELLVALAPFLPNAVLDATYTIPDDILESRAQILAALAPYLPSAVLNATPFILNDKWRVEILVTLAPFLPEVAQIRVLNEAWDIARNIVNKQNRTEALINLVPHLSPDNQVEVLQEALDTTRTLGDAGRRAEVLLALARFLPEFDRGVLLQQALYTGKIISEDIPERNAEEMVILAQRLSKRVNRSGNTSIGLWYTIMKGLSRRPRPEFMQNLTALMPFTLALVDNTLVPNRAPLEFNTYNTALRRYLHRPYVDLSTVEKRRAFLEGSGLLDLEKHLILEGTQDVFVQNLIHLVQAKNRVEDLVLYLQSSVLGWQEVQDFAAEILGTQTVTPAQQQLAQGILDAVQEVCSWWP